MKNKKNIIALIFIYCLFSQHVFAKYKSGFNLELGVKYNIMLNTNKNNTFVYNDALGVIGSKKIKNTPAFISKLFYSYTISKKEKFHKYSLYSGFGVEVNSYKYKYSYIDANIPSIYTYTLKQNHILLEFLQGFVYNLKKINLVTEIRYPFFTNTKRNYLIKTIIKQ